MHSLTLRYSVPVKISYGFWACTGAPSKEKGGHRTFFAFLYQLVLRRTPSSLPARSFILVICEIWMAKVRLLVCAVSIHAQTAAWEISLPPKSWVCVLSVDCMNNEAGCGFYNSINEPTFQVGKYFRIDHMWWMNNRRKRRLIKCFLDMRLKILNFFGFRKFSEFSIIALLKLKIIGTFRSLCVLFSIISNLYFYFSTFLNFLFFSMYFKFIYIFKKFQKLICLIY